MESKAKRESELHRVPSWKEMYEGGLASANSSPSRPPRAPTRTQSSSPSPPTSPANPKPTEEPSNPTKDDFFKPKGEEPAPSPLPMSQSKLYTQVLNPNTSLDPSNAQLALYIAMAHAGLAIGTLVLFAIGLLLKGYWKPIQWAVLISMPLREIQSVLVSFWQEPLQSGLLETLLAVPKFIFQNLVETGTDARDGILKMTGMGHRGEALANPSKTLVNPREGEGEGEKEKKKVGFAKLSRWMLAFAVCTVVYEVAGLIVLASGAFVGLLVYAGVATVWPVLESASFEKRRDDEKEKEKEKAKEENVVQKFRRWTVQPVVDFLRWSNRGATRSLAAKLPTVVATVLIILIFVGFLGGSFLFTYKVGMEAKDALVTLKTQIDHSNYAETTGLNKWIEENNVTQQLEAYMGQAYDTILQQIDAFAEKNNLTEAVNVGKEFLLGMSKKGKVVEGAHNETEMKALAVPSHPLLERLQNIKIKLRTYDFGGAYAESTLAASLGLELFQIRQDDFTEKLKQTLQKSSDIGKTLVVSGSSLMGKGFYLVLFLWSSLASGAAELLNIITQTIIFFSVLYYLITSESGGVMNQVLNMAPLSDSVRSRCAGVLDHAVSSVLLANLKAAVFQASFTWLLLTWFGIHFLYMSTFLAMSEAVFPLFPNWVAALPGGAQLALEGRYAEATALVALHVSGMDYGLVKIHREIPGHNSYLTGLSIAGGMALFSPALEGAILGPLIMTVLLAAKNLYAEFVLGIPMDINT